LLRVPNLAVKIYTEQLPSIWGHVLITENMLPYGQVECTWSVKGKIYNTGKYFLIQALGRCYALSYLQYLPGASRFLPLWPYGGYTHMV